MQFFLANSAWLWLLSLAVVPVLVHLFARSNPPKYAFSSTEFLHKIIKKTARMRKPQDWLLLLLRTLAVLALLLIFLQPLLTSDTKTQGGKKTTIYLIDRSASMACKDGAASRFSTACAKAVELLDSDSIDQANVIWIDAEPDALFPQPGPNIDYIREVLKRSEEKQELGAIAAALQLALKQLETTQGERELVILSDFQASAWEDFVLNVPSDIDVVKLKVGEGPVDNVAVHELFATPSDPVVGQDVLMVCRLRNYSATPRKTTLYLESDGGRQSKDVEIPAWGEAEVNFKTHFTHTGLLPLRASIAEDVFPADDRRHALVQVREALKLVVASPAEKSIRADCPEVLNRLATSLDWLEYRSVTTGNLPTPGSVDFLFLPAWEGQQIGRLQALAQAGTTLLVQPAVGCSLSALEKLIGVADTGSNTAIPMDSQTENSERSGAEGRKHAIGQGSPSSQLGWKAEISSQAGTSAKAFQLFKSGEFGNPASGVFRSRFRLPQQWPAGVRRLIDYQDGVPGLLMSRSSTGGGAQRAPVIIWNLPLASQLSNWAEQTPFVPFMGELLLSSRAVIHGQGLEVMPGSPLSWTPGDDVSVDSVSLFNHAGQQWPTTMLMTAQGAHLTSDQAAAPDLYQWKMGDGVAHQQIVNFPVTESDLRLIDPTAIEGGEVVDTELLLRRAALGDGVPLWPWLVAATLAFLLLEALVSMWKPRPSAAVKGDRIHP